MNKLNKISRNGVLVLIAVMLLTVPNMSVYSAVGSYQSNSMALIANKDYKASSIANDTVVWPAILAVAAGVGLAIVAGVGFIDGWQSIHSESTLSSLDFEKNHNRYDFSKFDN